MHEQTQTHEQETHSQCIAVLLVFGLQQQFDAIYHQLYNKYTCTRAHTRLATRQKSSNGEWMVNATTRLYCLEWYSVLPYSNLGWFRFSVRSIRRLHERRFFGERTSSFYLACVCAHIQHTYTHHHSGVSVKYVVSQLFQMVYGVCVCGWMWLRCAEHRFSWALEILESFKVWAHTNVCMTECMLYMCLLILLYLFECWRARMYPHFGYGHASGCMWLVRMFWPDSRVSERTIYHMAHSWCIIWSGCHCVRITMPDTNVCMLCWNNTVSVCYASNGIWIASSNIHYTKIRSVPNGI